MVHALDVEVFGVESALTRRHADGTVGPGTAAGDAAGPRRAPRGRDIVCSDSHNLREHAGLRDHLRCNPEPLQSI